MGKLVRNTSIYTFGNLFPQIIGFLLLPLYTEYLSPEDYGIVNSLNVLNAVLVILFTLAIERTQRLYFDYKTESEKRDFFGTLNIFLLLSSSAFLLLLFSFKNLVSQIYPTIPFTPFFSISITTAFITTFTYIPRMYLQLMEKAGQYVILSIAHTSLSIAAIIYFIVWKEEGAIGMLKGLFAGAAGILPFYIFITIKTINFTFKWDIVKSSLHYSLPIIPSLLAAWILNLSDRIFIIRYFSEADVGIYSLGYKIAGLVAILNSAIGMAYNPVFFKIASEPDIQKSKKELYLYNNIIFLIIIMACFLIAFFSKDIVILFMNEKYHEAHKIIPLICLAYLFNAGGSLLNRSFYQEKKTKQVMYITLLSAALNIILNFLLIPILGIYGAAYASILSMLFYALVEYILAKKYYFIPYNWKIIVPVSSLLLFLSISNSLFFGVSYLLLFVKLLITAFLVFLFYLKYRKEIHTLFFQKKF
jgi:O-antigen/teichoic acid export membrane protein